MFLFHPIHFLSFWSNLSLNVLIKKALIKKEYFCVQTNETNCKTCLLTELSSKVISGGLLQVQNVM